MYTYKHASVWKSDSGPEARRMSVCSNQEKRKGSGLTDMANSTKRIIMQTFEEMLEEMPFGKITVSALVARCEISSNTFYYHFKDIFDLLDAWLNKEKEQYQKEVEHIDNWAEGLKSVLHGIKQKSRQVYHIYDSLSRERLERYVFTSVESCFFDYVKERVVKTNVKEETLMRISNFYCYAVLGFFLKFLWEKMDGDIDSDVDELCRIFDGALEYILCKAETGEEGEKQPCVLNALEQETSDSDKF